MGEENCDQTPADIKAKVSVVSQDASKPSIAREVKHRIDRRTPHAGYNQFAPLNALLHVSFQPLNALLHVSFQLDRSRLELLPLLTRSSHPRVQ